MTSSSAKAATDWAVRGLIAFATMSLGVNSFLIREKVTEMATDIKTVAVTVTTLQTAQAVDRAQISSNTLRLDRYSERLQALEHNVTEIVAIFKTKSR